MHEIKAFYSKYHSTGICNKLLNASEPQEFWLEYRSILNFCIDFTEII